MALSLLLRYRKTDHGCLTAEWKHQIVRVLEVGGYGTQESG